MEKKYEDILNDLQNQFKQSLGEEEQSQELIEHFKDYLQNAIEQLKNNEFFSIQDENIIIKTLERNGKRVIDSPIEMKKQLLIEDKSMDELRILSNKIYKKALQSKEGKNLEINEEDTEQLEEKLKELIGQVKSWNYEEAKQLVSESTIELGIIENPNTDILSLRLGHIFGNKKNIEEEER